MPSIITKQNIVSAAEALRTAFNVGGVHESNKDASSGADGANNTDGATSEGNAGNVDGVNNLNTANNAVNTSVTVNTKGNSPLNPSIGIVLGSGLQNFGETIKDKVIVPYTEVPHIVKSMVKEHKGRFIIGNVAGKQVICMQGRLHPYEGHSADEAAFPIYVMKELGIQTLVVTNAAGGIDTSFNVGDIMLIEDQINLTTMSPCIGITDKEVGPRFFDMTHTYSPQLRKLALESAKRCGITLQSGVYIGVLGPNFETPAEIRAYRTLGAAAVGMSTVLEVIAAASQELPVLGLSLISNPAAGVLDEPLQMDDVYKAALIAAEKMENLLTDIIEHL